MSRRRLNAEGDKVRVYYTVYQLSCMTICKSWISFSAGLTLSPCPSPEWYSVGRFCYYMEYHQKRVSMPDASQRCARMNSSLPKFENQTELDVFAKEIMNDHF